MKKNKTTKLHIECYHCGKVLDKEQANYMRVKESSKPGSVKAPFCDECFSPYQE